MLLSRIQIIYTYLPDLYQGGHTLVWRSRGNYCLLVQTSGSLRKTNAHYWGCFLCKWNVTLVRRPMYTTGWHLKQPMVTYPFSTQWAAVTTHSGLTRLPPHWKTPPSSVNIRRCAIHGQSPCSASCPWMMRWPVTPQFGGTSTTTIQGHH